MSNFSVKKLIESLVREVIKEQEEMIAPQGGLSEVEVILDKVSEYFYTFNKTHFRVPVENVARNIGVRPEKIIKAIKWNQDNNPHDDYNYFIDFDESTNEIDFGDPMDV